VIGRHPIPRPPFTYASVDTWIRIPAPTIGQRNHEVLAEIGYSPEEIEELEASGVVRTTVKT